MRPSDYQFLCTIAGSDPTGSAGLQADLKTFAAHGASGTAVVTAVTVQDREGVHAVRPLDADDVAAQLLAALRTAPVQGVKTGMLWSASTVHAVALALALFEGPLVVDPVLGASAGGALLEADALPSLKRLLLPRARMLTPNLPEAAALLGLDTVPPGEEPAAALALAALGPASVLLKGGHATGAEAVDWLAERGVVTPLGLPRIPGASGHGTGCALSAALLARLARGESALDAAVGAKRYVHRALTASCGRGDGWLLDHGVPAEG